MILVRFMRKYIPYLAVKLLNVLHISGLKMLSKLAQNDNYIYIYIYFYR